VAVFIYLWNTNEEFRQFWIDLWNNIKSAVSTAANAIKTAVSTAFNNMLNGINTALNTALAGGGSVGNIVIPVYIGGDMIDEIVVMAQQRMNRRSGCRSFRLIRGWQRIRATEGCGRCRLS